MVSKPLFSVIIPVYNVEKYLKQCIDSVLSQKYDNYELILVDDGSTDSSPSICDEYAETYPNVKVIHKCNEGITKTRKIGVLESTGDYILSIDSDDWVANNYFTSIDEVIKLYSPDIVCFGAIYVSDKYKKHHIQYDTGFYDRDKIREFIFPTLIEDSKGRYFPPALWSKAIKRDLFIKSMSLVDDNVTMGEDYACTRPAIYEADSMFIVDKYLYYYRRHAQSITKIKHPYAIEVPIIISEKFRLFFKDDYDMQNQICRNFVHYLFNAVKSQFNRTDDYRLIKKDILNALADTEVNQMIENCNYDYSNVRGMLAKMCLQYKLIFLIKVINKIT